MMIKNFNSTKSVFLYITQMKDNSSEMLLQITWKRVKRSITCLADHLSI